MNHTLTAFHTMGAAPEPGMQLRALYCQRGEVRSCSWVGYSTGHIYLKDRFGRISPSEGGAEIYYVKDKYPESGFSAEGLYAGRPFYWNGQRFKTTWIAYVDREPLYNAMMAAAAKGEPIYVWI